MCLITNKEARTPPWHSINTIHIYLHVDDRCLPNKILQNEIQHPVPPWTLHPVAQFLGTGHHWALRLTESTVPGPRHSTSRPTASQSAARAQALDHLRSQILNKITYIRLTLDLHILRILHSHHSFLVFHLLYLVVSSRSR